MGNRGFGDAPLPAGGLNSGDLLRVNPAAEGLDADVPAFRGLGGVEEAFFDHTTSLSAWLTKLASSGRPMNTDCFRSVPMNSVSSL